MNTPMAFWPWAVVEITADSSAEDRCGLILGAYRASRAGVVGLALRGVTPDAVDLVLDQVVDSRDAGLKGVVYLDVSDERALLVAAERAGLVVASTANFRDRLKEHGIRAVEPREAGTFLSGAAAGRRPDMGVVA